MFTHCGYFCRGIPTIFAAYTNQVKDMDALRREIHISQFSQITLTITSVTIQAKLVAHHQSLSIIPDISN